MNWKERAKYLLVGAGATVLLAIMLGATNANDQGKYQLACTHSAAFVMDTSTGAVKVAWMDANGSQLNKPFAAMQPLPDLAQGVTR